MDIYSLPQKDGFSILKMSTHRKIKVMLVTGWMHFGGLERVVINLWRHMNRSHFEPFIVCTAGRGAHFNDLQKEGAQLFSLDSYGTSLKKYSVPLLLARIARAEHVDIIHTHNTGPMLDAALSTCFRCPGTLIHTDHARCFPDKQRYMIAERFASYFFSKIVAVSEETKKNLIQYEKISSEKITIINNGIEYEKYNSVITRQEARKLFKVDHFEHVVGLGVVLTEQKGIQYLIQSALEVLARCPNTGFVVAGDGDIRPQLQNLVEKLGVGKNFLFIGSTKAIPDFLQCLDVYVLPSVWEGLPLVILEAMAAKRCILSTSVGAIPQVLTNEKEGILIPPQNSKVLASTLIRLLEDRPLRITLAKNCHQRFLDSFTVQSMVRSYEDLYHKVLK